MFHSISYGDLTLFQVITHIKQFLKSDPKPEYSLVIGSDSQERYGKKGKTLQLITAIVVHRKGWGGRYFWRKKQIKNVHTLREKIYVETMVSLQLAFEFVPLVRSALNGDSPNYSLEIHIDVGSHGETREMIKEVVGMITGNGFTAKTKPEAYGATYVADKHT